jgi:hypothetical protein
LSIIYYIDITYINKDLNTLAKSSKYNNYLLNTLTKNVILNIIILK